MRLSIHTRFAYDLVEPAPLLIQIDAAETPGQRIVSRRMDLSHRANMTSLAGHGGVGARLWVDATERFSLDYRAEVEVSRTAPPLEALAAVSLHALPHDVVEYLMPSR